MTMDPIAEAILPREGREEPAPEPPPQPGRVGARVEPPVVGERVLRAGDGLLQRLSRASSALLPERLDPLAQTGAIANTLFLVAAVSGIVLLFWYRSSVHEAYASVAAMDGARFTSGLVRSIHRYSSDGCLLFVLLHATQLFFARRFGGARWLAWISGAFLIGTLWFVGWLGYWLVWDERAQQVALGTARMLDALPIFADPLSRSFLTDDGVNSLLFFVVFFVHMLVPLAMGVALWIHITRLSRPKFLANRAMTGWLLATLVAVSLLSPAQVAAPAHLAHAPHGFRLDALYLAPLALTDRLGAGALWAIALGAALLVYSAPWALARKRAEPATVDLSRCNGCTLCYEDCPYDAIRMVPRTDGRRFALQAAVDESKCIGCGICAGSCDPAGIALPWFDVVRKRHAMDAEIERAARAGKAPLVALVCAESGGAPSRASLPDAVVVEVPCAGWVHAQTVARALRHGARGVVIAACGEGSCLYREGPAWTKARMSGARRPRLDLPPEHVARVRVVEVHRHDAGRLVRAARELGRALAPRRWAREVAGLAAAAMALAAIVAGSNRVSYALPGNDQPYLVVSFKHPGQAGERCRPLTEEEKRKLPVHMRPPQICERARVAVRMRVEVDGQLVLERAYEPRGLWKDGNSVALERLAVPPGAHAVRVQISDTVDESQWPYETEQTATFEARSSRVVQFDKESGFTWR